MYLNLNCGLQLLSETNAMLDDLETVLRFSLEQLAGIKNGHEMRYFGELEAANLAVCDMERSTTSII